MKPKGMTIQMKTLDEYTLIVLFVLLLKRVHFLGSVASMLQGARCIMVKSLIS